MSKVKRASAKRARYACQRQALTARGLWLPTLPHASAHRAPTRRSISLAYQFDCYGSRAAVAVLSAAGGGGSGISRYQRRSVHPADLSSARRAHRTRAHLYSLHRARADQQMLLAKLGWTLAPESPPRITAASAAVAKNSRARVGQPLTPRSWKTKHLRSALCPSGESQVKSPIFGINCRLLKQLTCVRSTSCSTRDPHECSNRRL